MLEVAERVKAIVDGVRVVVDAGVIQVVLVRSAVVSIDERPSVGTARERVEELESWVVIEPVGVAVDIVVWGELIDTHMVSFMFKFTIEISTLLNNKVKD